MARKPNKSSPAADQQAGSSTVSGLVAWKFTKSMNMRDLARDDDYLSHLFIEKLGSLGSAPSLLVHRMDPFRRLPKTDTTDILAIVQRLVRARTSASMAIKQAVNELLELPSVLYFIRDYEQSQINAFATHASRYLELFLPTGSIEIAQTSRYSGITGKNELCILAMRPMQPGFLIAELKGSMADLTEEEDRELKRAGSRNDGGMRRDFSVIHSKQLKKNHLFLGPARFVNHDCDNNCELFRNGRYITFRAIKPIAIGQELTAHYGEGYFGKNNRHCLCETCERRGKGGFSPQVDDDVPPAQDNDDSGVDNDTDSDSTSVVSEESQKGKEQVNLNERRTRRGVYLVIPEQQNDSDESDEDVGDDDPQPVAKARAESVATTTLSEASTLSSSPNCVIDSVKSGPAPPISRPRRGRPPKAQPAQLNMPSNEGPSPKPAATRSQKAREASLADGASHLQTPPLVGGSASRAQSNSRASTSAVGSTRPSLRPRKSEPAPIPTPPPGPRPRGRPRKHPLPDGSATAGAAKAEEKPVEKAATRGRPSIALKVATAVTKTAIEKEALQQEAAPSIPACATCPNPLPVGDPATSRKEKVKDGKEDCPRCHRHFLIYGASWPQRTPTPGSRFPSTRENTPAESIHNVNHTTMSTFDHKLKAARLAQLKRSRENEQEAEVECARTSKRRKVSTLPSTPQKSGSSPSARARVPSAKHRERGGAQIKVENADDISLHGPLGRSASRNGRKRVAEPDAISSSSVGRKRGRPSAASDAVSSSFETPPFSEDGDDRRDKTFWPTLPTLPPPGDGIKRTGLLNVRPNPMHVSRWRASPLCSVHSSDSTPTLVDDDTDEATSDEHPATPENNDGHGTTPEVVDIGSQSRHPSGSRDVPPASDDDDDDGNGDEYGEENAEGVFRKPKKLTVSTLKGFGLIAKPSPLTLSKRIWAPAALIADPDCEDLNPPGVGEPTTPKRRRRGRSSVVSPKRAEGNSSTIDLAPTSDRSARVLEARVKKSMFDDFDASSGEEDVIVPGPSNSNLYLLQHNATFGSSASAQNSPLGSGEDRPCDGTLPSLQPGDLPKPKTFDNPILPTLGPLHSDFLASAPGSMPFPTFVDAGWESDSSV
ncbi:hypothetical protein M0805_001671 [Coniferiporia weirii]|nr:hypothetical protein M0805_001671 [Coniferiporia weirii]